MFKAAIYLHYSSIIAIFVVNNTMPAGLEVSPLDAISAIGAIKKIIRFTWLKQFLPGLKDGRMIGFPDTDPFPAIGAIKKIIHYTWLKQFLPGLKDSRMIGFPDSQIS